MQTVVNQGASGPGVIFKKRASLDFGTIATVATKEVTVAADDGEMVADAGDGVFWSPTAALTSGLVNAGARCTTTGVVGLTIGNMTAGTLTPNTVTVDIYIIKGGLEA